MGGPAKVVTNFVEDTSKTLTKITQPIEKAVTAGVEDTSKNLTSALQPVEKVITAVSQDPKALAAIAFAVAVPFASAQIAAYLTTAGLSQAAAAATASAITSITVQVAQGVPIEKATENALVNVAVSGATGAATNWQSDKQPWRNQRHHIYRIFRPVYSSQRWLTGRR